MTEVTAPAVTMLDNVVAGYIALRDKKTARKKKFEEDVAALDAAMDKMENFFLTTMRAQGLKSLPTAAGTPYMTTKTSVTVADPASYWTWVLSDPDRVAFLDIKANKTAVVAFKEEHDDLPPGLSWREEIACNVKR